MTADTGRGTLQERRPAADRSVFGPAVHLRLKDGQPLLYSVGENGVDNGGEAFLTDGRPASGPTGDFILWPR